MVTASYARQSQSSQSQSDPQQQDPESDGLPPDVNVPGIAEPPPPQQTTGLDAGGQQVLVEVEIEAEQHVLVMIFPFSPGQSRTCGS
jgi:hypothetical protein